MDNEPITKPTIETVLERINQLGNSLSGRLDTIEAEVSGIRREISGLRQETSGLRQDIQKLERRVEVLSIDVVKLRGDMRLIEEMVGPESKPS